ncbi:bifunctional phosphopantothenoylcysteine decarboxylase/phosphopantothenate--cysteine ligase CoaBC [Desulfovibrio ferrophilus]|uniref:Coenzyme A biosynthesis bifunctional protein CoaBC n=1 Tax=Desulfovibrio ferrophilus TaxID=241368 RepID=A0A2Z6B1Q7_9BACT|nr:bifunctional phosphopantothenoylcysteine decarboxylase/phosphopantothenate--cysteine ligase CoaBC [Desulfovibrio ferrophilus]BBD09388.1 phosphopantothenoylcysteinedecarboxylase/ phosphopantothenate/cysteine ligase [Desulfovibrio ferrophilus]
MQPHLAFTNFLGKRIHLGVCGSISAFKSLELLRMLQRTGAHLSATVTPSAARFVTALSFEALGAAPVYGDMFDHRDAVFGHLDPGQDADGFVVAPATANALAKLACGLADDMLSCQALAFPGSLVIAPAMNPRLWNAAATQENLAKLKERGHVCIEPECGDMACGEEGRGRFPQLESIYLQALKAVTKQDMAGRKVLITLGPTREAFDCVRFWSNPSSGTMGAAIAVAAWLRGAEVTAVCGPVNLWLPEGINRIDVTTAREMFDAASENFPSVDAACFTAAVADYRPANPQQDKFKKEQGGLNVEFKANPDILKTLGSQKTDRQFLIGFAAESSDIEGNCHKKLSAKNLDLIVGNDVTAEGCGFGKATNGVTVVDAKGRSESWPVLPKSEVGWRIWDWMLGL